MSVALWPATLGYWMDTLMQPVFKPAAIEQTLKSSGLSPEDGDALVRLGGMKMGVDGGFEGGFMREPYEEPYGEGGKFRGLQTTPPDRFNESVKLYNRLGWRVYTHAVGDAAIDEVLTAYEAADAEKSIAGRRWMCGCPC